MTEFVDSLPLCFQRNKLLSDGSDCEESDCSAGDSGLIPGLERSLGVGNGNLLPDSCWKTPWTEEPGGLQSWSFKESDMTEWLTFSLSLSLCFQRDELFGKLLPVFSCIVFDFMKQLQNDKSGNRFFFFFCGHLVFRCYCSHQDVLKNQASYFFPLQFSAVTFILVFSSYLLIPVRNYIYIPAIKLVRVVLVVKGERNCI